MFNNTKSSLIKDLNLLPHPEGGFYKENFRSNLILDTPLGKRSSSTAIYFLLGKNDKSHLHKIQSDELWHYYNGTPLVIIELLEDNNNDEINNLFYLYNNENEKEKFIYRYHFYIALFGFNNKNYHYKSTLLGNEFSYSQVPQYTVKNNLWFGSFALSNYEARLIHEFSKKFKDLDLINLSIEKINELLKEIENELLINNNELNLIKNVDNINDDDFYSLVGCTVSPGFEFQDFELATEKLKNNYKHAYHPLQFLTPK